jgi:predicted amidophosphoribosyltransferase
LSRLFKIMKKIFLTIFDLLFPRRENDAAILGISPECFYEKIPRWSNNEMFPLMKAIFRYKDPTAKAMIKELKSSGNKHAARIAAYALANFFQENNIRGAIIVPMPISKKRRKKRGYNQCEFIAEFFIKEMNTRETLEKITNKDKGYRVEGLRGKENPDYNPSKKILDQEKGHNTDFEIRTDILEKPIDTAKLAFLNRASRLKANEGVFRALCTPSHLEKRIIIIDDVVTTGSTMHSAIDTLRAAGAKNISGVSIAH